MYAKRSRFFFSSTLFFQKEIPKIFLHKNSNEHNYTVNSMQYGYNNYLTLVSWVAKEKNCDNIKH